MAYGSALAQMPGRTSHGMQIPPGYASVGVEEFCDPRFQDLELEIPGSSSQPGLSSYHARSPSPPHPFNSGGASDDDDRPQAPPEQPPAAKQAPKRSRAQSSKTMQPPKKKEPAKKKFEPIKRKLAWERTYEETDAISKKEVTDFFEGLRQARRQRELEEKNKVDPEKLKFFIKMQEEIKRKIELQTDYGPLCCVRDSTAEHCRVLAAERCAAAGHDVCKLVQL